jgi:hypothetical protein
VDEYTNMIWSCFLRRKAETMKKIVEFAEEMKARDRNMVKFLQCNNSPENKKSFKSLRRKESTQSSNLQHQELRKKTAKSKECSLLFGDNQEP